MSNSEALSIITGLLLPIVISLLKSDNWDRLTKILVTVALSGIIGLANSYFAGQLVLSWDKALVDAAIVLTTASTTYTMILEKSGLEQTLRGIGS